MRSMSVSRKVIHTRAHTHNNRAHTHALALARAHTHAPPRTHTHMVAHSSLLAHACQDGNTPLILACMRGHHAAVDRLVNGGADLNAVNDRQRTALMCACEVGLTPSVKLLVDRCVQCSHHFAVRSFQNCAHLSLKVKFSTAC